MPTQVEVAIAGVGLAAVETRIMAAIASGAFKPADYDILSMDLKVSRGDAKAAIYRRLYSGVPITLPAVPRRRKSKGWRRHVRRMKAGGK